MKELKFDVKPLAPNEIEVMKCLFFHGPTWDGNIPSKMGRDSLCDRGLAQHEFGFAWLTHDGVEIAINAFSMHRLKERWEAKKRPPYQDFK